MTEEEVLDQLFGEELTDEEWEKERERLMQNHWTREEEDYEDTCD